MNGRSAYIGDMESKGRVFMIEKTDYRRKDRSEVMQEIRDIIIENRENSDKTDRDLARDLKEMMDQSFGTYWHVVVGTDFSAFMSYSPGSYIQASYGDLTVLLFRLG